MNKEYTADVAKKYREKDKTVGNRERGIETCNRLIELSGNFKFNHTTLDLGCGTGRFHHCLRNIKHLTGVDSSGPMLEEAKNPIYGNLIDFPIDLIKNDIHKIKFNDNNFDFIISTGVFGESGKFDENIIIKIYRWLRAGGIALLTVVCEYSNIINYTKGMNIEIEERAKSIHPSSYLYIYK